MDIATLQTFVAVAETASFSRAAERVHLTQPAISKRIGSLEQAVDTRLFDRIGRRVQLTPAGIVLLEQARAILNEVAEAKRRIANLSDEIGGTLSLATSHHIGLHRLPPALQHFHDRYPQVRLDLRFLDSEAGCRAVAEGELELAIVTLPTDPAPQLLCIKVWDDPLQIVVGPHHPLATRRRIKAQVLLEHTAVLPASGTYTRELILDALGEARTHVTVGLATNYLEVLKMLVKIGLGWSALPETLIDPDMPVLRVEGVNIHRQLGIVTHRARTLSNAARAMIDSVQAGTTQA